MQLKESYLHGDLSPDKNGKKENKINKIKGSGKGPGGSEDKAEEPCSLHVGEGSWTSA